jgi:N-acyl-phosphatidylethanolamine-hydrolysing phospholipase D
LNYASWFKKCGIIDNVYEFDWWDSVQLGNIKYVFTPSQHWCARGVADRNTVIYYFIDYFNGLLIEIFN